MTAEPRPIQPGDMLHAACMRIFGLRHYGCAKVEAVGTDWLVARPINNDWTGRPMDSKGAIFASGDHVLVDAVRNRDGGLQESCRSSFNSGCSYDYTHDPDF